MPHAREARPAYGAGRASLSGDAGNYGCTATAAGLRVYPPGQRASKVVPYPLGACSQPGPVWMHAGPVQS